MAPYSELVDGRRFLVRDRHDVEPATICVARQPDSLDLLSLQMQIATHKEWIETLSNRIHSLRGRVIELEDFTQPLCCRVSGPDFED